MDINALNNIMNKFSTVFQKAPDKESLIVDVGTKFSVLGLGINILLFLALFIGVRGLFKEYVRNVQMKKLQGKIKTKKVGENPLLRIKQLRKLNETLVHTLKQKDKLERVNIVFNTVFAVVILIGILFIIFKQYLLAVIVPIFLLHYAVRILVSLEVSDLEYMYVQLPKGIDAILKASSRYEDVKSIFYEASKTLPQPIRGEFDMMARKMNSRETEEVLMEFKEKYDDIWMNSFIFILISMKEDAERNIALGNLANLREMLEKENSLKMTNVTERKISVNTNYTLAGFASVIGIGALLFSKSARVFYFSTPLGIICFVGGYALVLATIQINIRLSSTKEK